MKVQKYLSFLMSLIFLVVFNVIFFVAGGTDREVSVWISYVLIHFAYIMMVATLVFVNQGKSQAIFGFTIGSVSMAYFVAEFVIGVFFIFLGFQNVKPALFVQWIVAAIYLLLLMINMKANIATASSEAVHEAEVSFVKDASGRMKLMLDNFSDSDTNKAIERAFDYVRTSPSKSNPAVKSLEMDLFLKVGELGRAVSAQDATRAKEIAATIIAIMEERNRQLK